MRLASPGAITTVPEVDPAAGKHRTSPPGQWAMSPGAVTVPSEPATTAPARSTVRSVPLAEVTRIVDAAANRARPRATRGPIPSSWPTLSNTSGCSLESIKIRAPSAKIAALSSA